MAAIPPPANPITLLVQDAAHSYGGLIRPAPPQQPPTTQDVVESVRLHRRAAERHRKAHAPQSPEFVSDDALVACVQYEHVVTEQSLGIAGTPPWFQAWNNQHFQPFVNRVQGDLTVLKRDVTTLMIRDGQDRNSEFLVDDNGPFYEVPFPDGRRPWGLLVNVPNTGNIALPPLNSIAALQALTLPESYGYYAGYFPNLPVLAGANTLARRKAKIATAIGRIL
ncbi:hypothetical protein BDZ89DRAFT_1161491 [Hymenopellis radicata]|nr:hypothetical protein BDZ89DRAFT_1161491 [Hymenopellis radicata]